MKSKYSADDLPYHLIAPSLTGYALSSGPPVDRDWTATDTARIMHKLMLNLSFEAGYVAQGGDIGSSVARILAAEYDACKAIHRGHPRIVVDTISLTALQSTFSRRESHRTVLVTTSQSRSYG
jgi:pimeloyl-ACP methyl ester carboxylesterase